MTDKNAGELALYFDYISPNAYLAWKELGPLAQRFDRTVNPIPILYPGVLSAHGLLGPMEVGPKARWMKKNILRKTHRLGIPFAPPPTHPFNPLLALRVSCVPMPEAARLRLIDGLFQATWGGGPGVTDTAVVARIASEAGLEGESIVAQAASQKVKDLLRQSTEEAVAEGVFGVPMARLDGELFWGFDDLEYLERALAGDDAFDEETLRAWNEIHPSARRRPAH